MQIAATRTFAVRNDSPAQPAPPANPTPEPTDPVEGFDWSDAKRGAIQGGLTYGLPALAGAFLPKGIGLFAGLAIGAGMGVYEARNSSPESKVRSAMGGMLIGMASANCASFFPTAGPIGLAVLGAGAMGYYYGSN